MNIRPSVTFSSTDLNEFSVFSRAVFSLLIFWDKSKSDQISSLESSLSISLSRFSFELMSKTPSLISSRRILRSLRLFLSSEESIL